MQKLLILITVIASLFQSACSSDPIVNRLPWVYRIDVQQGNVVTQDAVDQLKTGMTKRQVQFILGAPMVNDPFHADRWDYYYAYAPGSRGKNEAGREHLSLVFDGDTLVNIKGTLQPAPSADDKTLNKTTTVTVPPQEVEEPGILTRLWRWIIPGNNDD